MKVTRVGSFGKTNEFSKKFHYFAALVLGVSLNASTLYSNPSFESEFDKMDRYVNAMMNSHFQNSSYNGMIYPKLNMLNEEDKYVLNFNVAGLDKDEIKLSINQDNVLTLEGERKTRKKDEEKSMVRREMFYGKFKRILQLPENVDQSKLTSRYDNGILTVVIPKKEAQKSTSKTIKIK